MNGGGGRRACLQAAENFVKVATVVVILWALKSINDKVTSIEKDMGTIKEEVHGIKLQVNDMTAVTVTIPDAQRVQTCAVDMVWLVARQPFTGHCSAFLAPTELLPEEGVEQTIFVTSSHCTPLDGYTDDKFEYSDSDVTSQVIRRTPTSTTIPENFTDTTPNSTCAMVADAAGTTTVGTNTTITIKSKYEYLVMPYGAEGHEDKWMCWRVAIAASDPASNFSAAVLACDWPQAQKAAAGRPPKMGHVVADRQPLAMAGVSNGARDSLWNTLPVLGLTVVWSKVVSYVHSPLFTTAGSIVSSLTPDELRASGFVNASPLEGISGGVVLNTACEAVGVVQGRQGDSFGVFTRWTAETIASVKAAIREAVKEK